jgi:hypothetical protein
MPKYESEMDRIKAGERWEREYIDSLPPEVVERYGAANIVSDLCHDFPLFGNPSQELLETHGLVDESDPPDADDSGELPR